MRREFCMFDKLIQRSCGHQQRYVRRIKDEAARRRRVAELEPSRCRPCQMLHDLAQKHGVRSTDAIAKLVCNQRLEELRMFVAAVLAAHDALKYEPEPFHFEVGELGRRLFRTS
jgi:hypothetical protein